MSYTQLLQLLILFLHLLAQVSRATEWHVNSWVYVTLITEDVINWPHAVKRQVSQVTHLACRVLLTLETQKLREDQIEVFKILKWMIMVMKILILIFLSKLRKAKWLEDTTSRWWRNKVDWMLESTHSPKGPSMYAINYQLIMCMIVVSICSRTE